MPFISTQFVVMRVSPLYSYFGILTSAVCFGNIQLSFQNLFTNHPISRNGQDKLKMDKKSVKRKPFFNSSEMFRKKSNFFII